MIRARVRSTATAGIGLALFMGLCGPTQAQQGEAAVIRRAAELRASPSDNGRSLGTLPVQEPVTRLPERQGAWVQVQTRAGVSGWVHMFDVAAAGALPAAASESTGNPLTGGLRSITSILRGSSAPPPRVSTSTIGIRGLEAEDLARAQPNLAAVGQMERLREGEAGAREFAAEAALASSNAPALPGPSTTRSPLPVRNTDPSQQ